MEKLFRTLIAVAAITLALVCVANTTSVKTSGTPVANTTSVKTSGTPKNTDQTSRKEDGTSLTSRIVSTDRETGVTDHSSHTSLSYDTTSSTGGQTNTPGHSTQSPSKGTTYSSTDKPADWCYCNETTSPCKKCQTGTFIADKDDDTKFYKCAAAQCFLCFQCMNHTIWDNKNLTCIHSGNHTAMSMYSSVCEDSITTTRYTTGSTGHGTGSTPHSTGPTSKGTSHNNGIAQRLLISIYTLILLAVL